MDADLIKEFSAEEDEEKVAPENYLALQGTASTYVRSPGILPQKLKGILLPSGENLYDTVLETMRGILDGLDFATACLLAGISPEDMASYMKQYTIITRVLNFAYANNMLWWTEKVKKAATNDWKAAAFYLERRYTSLFGEVKTITRKDLGGLGVSPGSSQAVDKKLEDLSDEELMSLVNN